MSRRRRPDRSGRGEHRARPGPQFRDIRQLYLRGDFQLRRTLPPARGMVRQHEQPAVGERLVPQRAARVGDLNQEPAGHARPVALHGPAEQGTVRGVVDGVLDVLLGLVEVLRDRADRARHRVVDQPVVEQPAAGPALARTARRPRRPVEHLAQRPQDPLLARRPLPGRPQRGGHERQIRVLGVLPRLPQHLTREEEPAAGGDVIRFHALILPVRRTTTVRGPAT